MDLTVSIPITRSMLQSMLRHIASDKLEPLRDDAVTCENYEVAGDIHLEVARRVELGLMARDERGRGYMLPIPQDLFHKHDATNE